MKGVFKANYISQRTVNGKENRMYFFAKFVDDENGELEVQMEKPITNLIRFEECKLLVDIVQGKFPRYNLVSLEKSK
jgi:hypothetical protein